MVLRWPLTNREKAWIVIKEMDNEWVTSRELASLAGISVAQMTNFLKIAKKMGIVEHKQGKIRHWTGFQITVGLWRKIRDFNIDEVI